MASAEKDGLQKVSRLCMANGQVYRMGNITGSPWFN